MGQIDLSGHAARRGFLGAISSAVLGVFAATGSPIQTPQRRVVTGADSSGKSMIVSDGQVPPEGMWSSDTGNGADLWFLQPGPVDLSDARDPIASYADVEFPPPPGGVLVRMLTWQPGFSYPMHRTASIDFIIIVSGRLELILDSGATTVGPGDCIVQRGTNHGWRVVGTEPCTFAGIAVGAKA